MRGCIVGKEEFGDYEQNCIKGRLEESLRTAIDQVKWATLMQVTGTCLKMNIPQRIYRTPPIIGKRQILRLSSGRVSPRIKYKALVPRKTSETKGRLS